MPEPLAIHRLRSQRLVGPPLETPADVVQWLGAVQSQDYPGALWAIARRLPGTTTAEVEAAFDRGEFVRTHVLRPTWHFVRPEELRWMQALTGPRVRQLMRSYDRNLEIDADVIAQTHRAIEGRLAGGRSATRTELAAAMAEGGFEAKGQRLAHLVMHAELDALVCSGPSRGKHQTYALVDERIPSAPDLAREEALVMLARRYFTSHGPATAQDFAWWSGLTVADARAALASLGTEATLETLDGKLYAWIETGLEAPALTYPLVHLLPNYDEHIVAYRDHGPSMDPTTAGATVAFSTALARHFLVRDGLIVGGWKRTLEKEQVIIESTLLTPLSAEDHAAVRAEAEAYGRALGLPVALETG